MASSIIKTISQEVYVYYKKSDELFSKYALFGSYETWLKCYTEWIYYRSSYQEKYLKWNSSLDRIIDAINKASKVVSGCTSYVTITYCSDLLEKSKLFNNCKVYQEKLSDIDDYANQLKSKIIDFVDVCEKKIIVANSLNDFIKKYKQFYDDMIKYLNTINSSQKNKWEKDTNKTKVEQENFNVWWMHHPYSGDYGNASPDLNTYAKIATFVINIVSKI